MLLQRKSGGGLRCIEQHAHALICGPMAASWCGAPHDEAPPSFEGTLAISLHDWAWRELDERPPLNEATALPHDFLDYPHEPRVALYERGVDVLEAVHPYVALLVSLHYTTFAMMAKDERYQAHEASRRERLAAQLPAELAAPERQARELSLLKLFDTLSLFVCLAPPEARRDELPEWLTPDAWAFSPDGAVLHLEWRSTEVLAVEPFPWRAPLALTVPYRDVSAETFADQAALDTALAGSTSGHWTVHLVG